MQIQKKKKKKEKIHMQIGLLLLFTMIKYG